MNVGEQLPVARFQATSGIQTTFDNYRGQWLVIYFYPKDATSGCTIEGCDFRDHEKAFSLLNTVILGVSRDSLSTHEKFKAKQSFPFELISDPSETLCQLFDVIKMKSLYGKETLGIERSTFIADPNGIIRYMWRKVNVKGHVEEVLRTLKSLQL